MASRLISEENDLNHDGYKFYEESLPVQASAFTQVKKWGQKSYKTQSEVWKIIFQGSM